ncbi:MULTISPECIES: extracellular solute-binding protein [unclassified Chelatococcus]|uniref:ABC transporter substrate-binding protein n=1 Tax=unclassified Chelatococcus TaxID=2638111 RepID=UPI001BCAFFEA|nr:MULTISPECIES: extracellular solute-binding protein [unclassified Chelatococcus]CAH1656990.1 Multiple sugar transport system substrate-binding protein [Hyphomicrobiales bacterium]MBS7742373.1 extracellular solute-binding protein [Chelatococcus sp. HY11]MBX3542509.1 extracellular solute-binding protein [Chelatococcus sp.]MCO5075274.1 extracellular solute-binding protein [Chelatococcus sp.]CAH1695943.1 Multiple sugar transport system substrate-binding protein [Hyphomicrobiales bacterium]
MLTRRHAVLGIAGATLSAAVPARAEDKKLTIVAHAVHRAAATTGKGGDITASWREKNGANIEWLTFGVDATNERALREAGLSQGSIDIAFVLNGYVGPQYAQLFEDLKTWQARDPIPAFDEIPDAMLATHRYGEHLAALPYRHATHGLHYNSTLFAERGIADPPKTIAELIATAEKLSYERPDGTRVYGFVLSMEDLSCTMDWIRAFGGDFITPDLKVVVDEAPAVKAVATLRELVQKNVMPRNIMNFKNEDVINHMQQGRAAMTNSPFGRYATFNDPKASKFQGKIPVVTLPDGIDGMPIPAKTSVWAMAIPRNTRNKELAWSLVRHLSTPESTILATLNGNGPVRPSAYNDKRVQELLPYANAEKTALSTARLITPSFANAPRAMNVLMEELGLALLGRKEPQAAMSEAKARVVPLLTA